MPSPLDMMRFYTEHQLTETSAYKTFEKSLSLNFVEAGKTNADLVTDIDFKYNFQ